MSGKMVALVGGVSGAAVAAWTAPAEAMMVLGTAAVAVSCWFCGKCHHRGPLGLLPPVELADGTRQGSQWFCDACGKSWPAGIEHASTPIVKYAGYDQSKLPLAAKRAADLARKKQEMAVRRAGIGAPRTTVARQAPATSRTIVSIQQGRRVAVK